VAAALVEASGRGLICGCADVRFANGADDALIRSLLARDDFSGLAGYAGWNTCSNSLGTVVAQVVLTHAARTRLSEVRLRQVRRRVLTRRLLDDWGYQAVVRPFLGSDVVPRFGVNGSHLGEARATVQAAALKEFRERVIPPVERALGPSGFAGLSFPWDRLFEVDVHLPDASQAFEGGRAGG
jgi:hypothetical protein